MAVRFLEEHGLEVVDRNVFVDGGEVDVVASDSGARVAVEVRTITGGKDPIDAIDQQKRERVRRLAGFIGAKRVDFVGVRMDRSGVELHWLPGD